MGFFSFLNGPANCAAFGFAVWWLWLSLVAVDALLVAGWWLWLLLVALVVAVVVDALGGWLCSWCCGGSGRCWWWFTRKLRAWW